MSKPEDGTELVGIHHIPSWEDVKLIPNRLWISFLVLFFTHDFAFSYAPKPAEYEAEDYGLDAVSTLGRVWDLGWV